MKKHILLILAVALAVIGMICFSNRKYTSHYSAVAHGTTGGSDSASVFFWRFEGTEVFKMRIVRGRTARIQTSGKLESGSLTVYYDCGGAKTELFSVHSGDDVNVSSEELPSGLVYVILETSEACENGDFSFAIHYE